MSDPCAVVLLFVSCEQFEFWIIYIRVQMLISFIAFVFRHQMYEINILSAV